MKNKPETPQQIVTRLQAQLKSEKDSNAKREVANMAARGLNHQINKNKNLIDELTQDNIHAEKELEELSKKASVPRKDAELTELKLAEARKLL